MLQLTGDGDTCSALWPAPKGRARQYLGITCEPPAHIGFILDVSICNRNHTALAEILTNAASKGKKHCPAARGWALPPWASSAEAGGRHLSRAGPSSLLLVPLPSFPFVLALV